MHTRLIKQFLKLESSSGIILLMMAILAIIWANSPLSYLHQKFVNTFLFWINELLMSVFFLVVGLELKRSYLEGLLSHFSQVFLPFMAALGGMLIPAFIYWAINYSEPLLLQGWATPVATDIAFAVGILSLFGRRVPISLHLFLLLLAIFDDIGAIIIIVLFYSHNISYLWLLQSFVWILLLYFLNHRLMKQSISVSTIFLYFLLGACLWIAIYQSGIHPSISGLILAFFIPNQDVNGQSLLNHLENTLHPWVAYGIVPLFVLANAGLSLQGISLETLENGIVLGIIAGLFLGKQIGVFSFSWLSIQLGKARLPEKSHWLDLYGVSILCGIGFTMSLFLGTLSFPNENSYLAKVRLGVIIGSILSGLMGALILLISLNRKSRSKYS